MRRSDRKILTSHVGSLPYLSTGSTVDDDDAKMREAVAAVVQKQKEIGLDIINEGEYAKRGDWLSYTDTRLGGFEPRPQQGVPPLAQGKDREVFADFYRYAGEKGTLFYSPGNQIRQVRPQWVCTGPISYTGQQAVQAEIDMLRSAIAPGEEAFLTCTAPASLEVYRPNQYYGTEEAFLFALAGALKEEYEAIAKAGLLLQVDDAWLPALWDRIGMQMGLAAFRKRCELRVEALNHALSGIPEDRIRYHLCWGSWHGPHLFDLELEHIVDLMLKVRAGAYLIEAANARHEHEYEVWDEVKLPEGKILIPGVISHSTDGIEHPELVSQRIRRFAERVGRTNVIAGADCGFGGRSHPQIAWAKLAALVQGAERASSALRYG